MSNEVPTIWSEGLTVPRLNALLDLLTAKKFVSAALAAQTIRAALNLHGIILPILEVEGGVNGHYTATVADGPDILRGGSMSAPEGHAPQTEGEWLFKIKDADGPDNDFDDYLSLYIVMDLDEHNFIECYANILTDGELDSIAAMDDMTDDDFQKAVSGTFDGDIHAGDINGESEYQKRIRHIGTIKLPS